MTDTDRASSDSWWLIRHPSDGQWATVGFRDDILRAFAEWLIAGAFSELKTSEGYPDFREFAGDYIESLAAKEDNDD